MDENIKQLLSNYKPSQQAIETLRKQRLVIFAGVTGSGKNTIMNELLKTGKYHDIVTSTTRLPRENNGVMEQDGVDYYFLTPERAVEKLKAGEYIEVAEVHERINGLLASELQRAKDAGKIPIIDVDVQGVKTYTSLSDNIVTIFVVPPSYDEWLTRMKCRYDTEDDFLAAWPVRRQSAIMELEDALREPYYHFIVNEDLGQAVHSAEKIMEKGEIHSQIDKSYRVWVESILDELKKHS
jgi:guanylate kinase